MPFQKIIVMSVHFKCALFSAATCDMKSHFRSGFQSAIARIVVNNCNHISKLGILHARVGGMTSVTNDLLLLYMRL